MQTEHRPGLSIVVITYNEENNIGRCLESVRALADEIVVVDSLSTDSTVEICKSYGATVIDQQFLGYIEQKNFALRQASFSYILSLDADEALSSPLADYILAEKQKGFNHDAYRFNRLSNYCGQWIKHGSWYPDRKIRLVRNGLFTWGGENPHDKLIGLREGQVHTVPKDIFHFSYVSYADHVQQTNRFSSIAAMAMHQKNKKAGLAALLVRPAWAFIRSYILKAGFLDGINGYIIAKMVAFGTFLKYMKLMELNRQSKETG